jgi:cytochrome P450 family 2 subfamily U polypeptide 1
MRMFGFGRRCMESQIMEEIDCLMNELEKHENEAFDIQALMAVTVSNVICSFVFGKRFDHKDARFKQLTDLIDEMFASMKPSSPAFIFPMLRHIRMFNLDKTEELSNTLLEYTDELIDECKRSYTEDNISNYIHAYLLEQKRRVCEPDTTFTGTCT